MGEDDTFVVSRCSLVSSVAAVDVATSRELKDPKLTLRRSSSDVFDEFAAGSGAAGSSGEASRDPVLRSSDDARELDMTATEPSVGCVPSSLWRLANSRLKRCNTVVWLPIQEVVG